MFRFLSERENVYGKTNFSGTREEIRKKSTDFAFYKLYLLLSKEFSKSDDNDV